MEISKTLVTKRFLYAWFFSRDINYSILIIIHAWCFKCSHEYIFILKFNVRAFAKKSP
jgi:hypothetical protein